MDLIERYSQRRLTYESDRLLAVYGLAEMAAVQRRGVQITSSMRDIYAGGGVFRSGLRTQLLWHAKRGGRRITNPYQAPTWSWASIKGAVYYSRALRAAHDLFERSMRRKERKWPIFWVTVHGFGEFSMFTSEDKDTPGSVNTLRTELTLEGMIVPVAATTVKHRGRVICLVRPQNGGTIHRVQADEKQAVEVRNPSHPTHGCLIREPSDKFGIYRKGEWCEKCAKGPEYWAQPEFSCLRIASWNSSDYQNHEVLDCAYFLVLRRSRLVPGAWERVGIGRINENAAAVYELFG